MKLHFDPNQQFQHDAINSIVEIFEGQPLSQADFSFSISSESYLLQEGGVGNRLIIGKEQILENVQSVQDKNELPVSDKLDGMHFSIEMETGTGKTYVYLRTIYELNKKYGFKKFVIVVPSIAIREGVLKNLEITFEHFQNLYDKTPVNFNVYDSKRVSNLRNFAINNNIQILVINIDSFAKDENIINKPNDKLTGKRPIEFIQATGPIVIVDEPQNMETEIRKKAIENLNPLCTLRYSATHTNRYNMVYSLDPVEAYDLGLVKQIEVDSIVTENDFNEAFLCLKKVTATKTRTSAKIKIDVNNPDGVKRKSVTAKVGDDLYDLSNKREIYKNGYIINGIDISENLIEFSNGETVFVGDTFGGLSDEIMKVQIRKTVEEHFLKERKLKSNGIKVLSLFFIDRVANYRDYDSACNPVKGKFAKWFEEIYKEISSKTAYKDLIPFDAEEVHNGYFSADKKGKWKDTKGNTQADDDTFKLIMKNKEQLLNADEPLRFIFSHSALREGWDNPNVFQICTLNETQSELKKRQEIGRGLRLSVNQEGIRIQDTNINRLTVVANESYEDFAKQLQSEIEEDCGVSFKGRIKNRRERTTVKYRKGFELDEKFKDIWDKIKYQTTYRVEYNTSELIKKSAKAVNQMPDIRKAVIKTTKTALEFDDTGIVMDIKASYATSLDGAFRIPDMLFYIQERTELTRSTILEILRKSERIGEVLINPQLFLDNTVIAIKDVLMELMIEGIKYEKIGSKEYEMRLFDDYEIHVNELTFKINKKDKTIYSNLVPLDSNVEYEFARECESRDDIEFYFKLPFWFKIKTPIGNYNPDWALIKKNEKTVYFVAETKSAGQELKTSEKRKIKCGYAHFNEFEDVKYRQVATVGDLH
ncbi:DEAD/DEAH box helicase family protein [Candidatus Oleimmundimicrobium sp.]|uniref:restriction endonuclease n=1 Tax=Candidatus Oleimmundimicrobium sp. TaxID=3060597 RepID=UPI00271E35F2|nr:DEAD/DEAH box helicase family protein [Candidatus Oleimmundimicrobium sp.]MDO8886165.1 DEAD/DEAH box helicase family protein [Candidatus Oleimmundimicrobium sp.]